MNIDTQIKTSVLLYKKEAIRELSRNILWMAIITLIPHRDFQLSIDWLEKKLGWASFEEIAEAITGLKESGLLRQNENGLYEEVSVKLNDYLSHEEILQNDYIYSSDLRTLVTNDYINTKRKGVQLWSWPIYQEVEYKILSAISNANKQAESLPIEERDMLIGYDFNMVDIAQKRKPNAQSGGVA